MKNYIKPSTEIFSLNTNSTLLADSGITIGISDDPADSPAQAKSAAFDDSDGMEW